MLQAPVEPLGVTDGAAAAVPAKARVAMSASVSAIRFI
jgi:hypothetical protein